MPSSVVVDELLTSIPSSAIQDCWSTVTLTRNLLPSLKYIYYDSFGTDARTSAGKLVNSMSIKYKVTYCHSPLKPSVHQAVKGGDWNQKMALAFLYWAPHFGHLCVSMFTHTQAVKKNAFAQ